MPRRQVDAIFHRLFAEVGAQIDCTECGNCCREMSPLLRPKDIVRLSERLRTPPEEFRRAHLRESEDGPRFASQPCPLLDGKKCSCYEDRPRDCREYPHLDKSDMPGRMLGVLDNAHACPIVYNVLERVKVELSAAGHRWRRRPSWWS